MAGNLLFSPDLIPRSVIESLPEGYNMRPLSRDDFSKGIFECLEALTWTGSVTEAAFQERFDWMKWKGEGWFYNVVIEHNNRIIGTGALIAGRKFIWDLASTGHIEDVSILKSYQGKGLGKRLIQALDGVAENVGCCKTLLNCKPENEAFYAKCGYKEGGMAMKHDLRELK